MSAGRAVDGLDESEEYVVDADDPDTVEEPAEIAEEDLADEDQPRFPFFDVASAGDRVHVRAGIATNGGAADDLVIDALVPLQLADSQMAIAREWYTRTIARIYNVPEEEPGDDADEDGSEEEKEDDQ